MLEIKVTESVQVVDTLPEVQKLVEKIILEWFESGKTTPLEITIERKETRAPPALGINVGEEVKLKEVIG